MGTVVREKELRLALVCYGGVSLAIYMHGVTKEVWKLLRASQAFHSSDPAARAALTDSEAVYADLLALVDGHVRLRVLVDIIAGASAGGINGILLGHAIAGGHDMECLRDLWLEKADVEVLLDPDARPESKWSKLYAAPIAWYFDSRRSSALDTVVDPVAREEVKRKLSRFVRSRWFQPPFSGVGFSALLLDALAAMGPRRADKVLLPASQPLDLFVTVTDYYGHAERLRLHSPSEIVETEHRKLISFSSHMRDGRTKPLGSLASLALAARATASFPGAFPPFQVREMDTAVSVRNTRWEDRDSFLAELFPTESAQGHDMSDATLIDGSVLNNAPFAPAIAALRNRPAHREVDRRFVYIDPKPGPRATARRTEQAAQRPGFFSTILRSLSDIPREQPIRDDLEQIDQLTRRVQRLRHVVDGMRDDVDDAIEGAVGRTVWLLKPTAERLSQWRFRVNAAAAREAGYAYAAYGQLKLAQVTEQLAQIVSVLAREDDRIVCETIRERVWDWVRARGIDNIGTATRRREGDEAFVNYLRRFDLGFRIRRLRFLIRRLTELQDEASVDERPAYDALRTAFYELLAPFIDRRARTGYSDAVALACTQATALPDAAIQAVGDAMDLTGLDQTTDARLVELLSGKLPMALYRGILLAYLGFPFYDAATLPLLQGEGLDEFDEIKVDRLSPDDARTIREGGTHAMLKGVQFNNFGAFFSRAYRENDYLWGRLNGLDRLVDIVLSALPPGAVIDADTVADLKRRAFRAILDAERPHLGEIGELFESLDREIG